MLEILDVSLYIVNLIAGLPLIEDMVVLWSTEETRPFYVIMLATRVTLYKAQNWNPPPGSQLRVTLR